ncbi:MAG: hypothetical protein IJJ33_07350 [Victivallales bacterium]|nr:hypothetical protein [Victivallales bacterium]
MSPRLRNPRIIIYPVALVLAICLMKWHERLLARKQGQSAQPSAPVVRMTGVATPAELAPESQPSVKLFLFGEIPQARAETLKRELADECAVLSIRNLDDSMREYFRLSRVPAVILFDADNREILRLEQWGWEELPAQVRSHLPVQPVQR